MKRRAYLKGVAASPLTVSTADVAATEEATPSIERQYFDTLGEIDQANRGDVLVRCADSLCLEIDAPNGSVEQVVNSSDDLNEQIRRIRFGVRILNEQNITNTIDESMVGSAEKRIENTTRFLPLIGSVNNLRDAACSVDDPPRPEQVERFLYAALAFGVEVTLWYTGAPYKMAWRGTRFVSNRSFLRFANRGCDGCIAFLMSELHWGLRAVPYNLASEDTVPFVKERLEDLRETAEATDYEADLEYSEQELKDLIERPVGGGGAFVREPQGPIERHLPPLPDISDIIPKWL
jgi:hypothetical protein